MKKIISFILCFSLVVSFIPPLQAKNIEPQLINNAIEAVIYSYKKTADYVAVEIGFTNSTDQYLEFTPQEIYLDDKDKYSVSPMPYETLQSLPKKSSGGFVVPLILGTVLGISALAVGNSNSDLGTGLAIAALGMGGVFVISAALESKAKNNHLIAFSNNSLRTVSKIPPGMTLGGFLYFPPTKKPTSVTIVARSRSGKYEKKIFQLKKTQKSRNVKANKYLKD